MQDAVCQRRERLKESLGKVLGHPFHQSNNNTGVNIYGANITLQRPQGAICEAASTVDPNNPHLPELIKDLAAVLADSPYLPTYFHG